MSEQALVRAVLEQRLRTWNASRLEPLALVWQNSPETPGETYLAVYLLPVGVRSFDLEGAHRVYEGIFQINIVTRAGEGSGDAEDLLQELSTLFPVNLRLVGENDVVVIITTPMSPGGSTSEANAYTQPVSCQVRSDTI
jgi:hypothetical protein